MIAVVGEALVDLVIAPDGSVAAHLGGAPYNAARAAARLGASVRFYGSLSSDRFGQALAEQLSGDGVDISGAERVDAPTTLAAAELDADGSATYRFYVSDTSAPQFRAAAVKGMPTDYLLTGGLALVLQPMADEVESLMAEPVARCGVMVDLNSRPTVIDDRPSYVQRVERVLGRVDVLKVSADDLRYLRPDAPPTSTARDLTRDGIRLVLLTDGDADVGVFTCDGECEIPVPETEVVDTVGAGDTFCGAFLASSSLRGLDFTTTAPPLDVLAEVVANSIEAAAAACRRSGADPPWVSDLAEWPRPHR